MLRASRAADNVGCVPPQPPILTSEFTTSGGNGRPAANSNIAPRFPPEAQLVSDPDHDPTHNRP